MSSMPIIDDRMVDLFRRTGKRRASYRSAPGGRAAAGAQHVFLQGVTKCSGHGTFCVTNEGNPGKCFNGICMITAFPGDRPFDLLA
jgi:hypothetical protein